MDSRGSTGDCFGIGRMRIEMAHPTDEQLREWSKSTEDHFIERKTLGDSRDWARTVVAFANSMPLDRYGVLYIGMRDDGTIQDVENADDLQKTVRQKLNAVYPTVEYTTRALTIDGQRCLCVIVPGSPRRPHCAGPAYVRVGSETIVASASVYDALIAERSGKVYRIRQFVGQTVCVQFIRTDEKITKMLGRIETQALWRIDDCNQFCASFRDQYGQPHAVALDRIDVLTEPFGVIVLQVRP